MYSIKNETLVSTRSLENKKIITHCWTRSQENSHRDGPGEIWDHENGDHVIWGTSPRDDFNSHNPVVSDLVKVKSSLF